MRVVIFGTGGAGGYFGAQLARAGEDVILIARGQHLNAIRMHGLCIETPAGEILIRPAQATDDAAQVSNVDVVLVGVKAWQVEEAAKNLRPMMGPKTFVVPLQNEGRAAARKGVVAETHRVARIRGIFCADNFARA
jgi:2-dehydropantoate 2-reductase